MEKCQYTEYQRYSNLPKHPINCSIMPAYEKEGKKYCYFHYLRLFFTDLSIGQDESRKNQIKEVYPKVFEQDDFLFTPFIFYNKFNELLATYQGDVLDISGFVFPTEKNDNIITPLSGITQANRDSITIKSQYLGFYDSINNSNYFSNQSYSHTSLDNRGTIIFQNIYCNKSFIFKQKNEEYNTLKFIDCNFQEFSICKDTPQDKIGNMNLSIEHCKINKYKYDPVVNNINIDKSEITNLSNAINIDSFKVVDSTISNNIKIDITANSISLEDVTIGSENHKTEEVSLTIPFHSTTLSNNILQNPLFSYVSHVKIIDNGSQITRFPASQKPTTLFHNVDIRNMTFYDSKYEENKDRNPNNLTNINFLNCKYNDGHRLYELGVSPKRLEYSYLHLREIYDNRGEYIAGNDFHYNYYEIKRKYDKNLSMSDKFFLLLFSVINGHNTKPIYTVGWLIILLILFWNILEWCSFYPNNGIVINTTMIYDSYSNPLEVMGGAFYAATSGLLPTSLFSDKVSSSHLFTMGMLKTEGILSTILLAFLALAIRNRFRRNKEIVDIGGGK